MNNTIFRVCTLVVSSAFLFQCAEHNKNLPSVSMVVGKAELRRAGNKITIDQQSQLRNLDTLSIGEQSKLNLQLSNSGILNCNMNTMIALNTAGKDGEIIMIPLLFGEMFTDIHVTDPIKEYRITTTNATIQIQNASLSVSYDRVAQTTLVQVISGSIIVKTGKQETTVPACTRLEIVDNVGELLPISEEGILNLKNWVGRTAIEAPLTEMGCLQKVPKGDNLPPSWVNIPLDKCPAGEIYNDIIRANDPEGRVVKYQLLSGPQGMTLDSLSGHLSFSPLETGSHDVNIRATDEDSLYVDYNYKLTVSSGIALLLSAPKMVKPGETFTITATPIRKAGSNKGLTYRFDLNGDNEFEIPGKGVFGPSSTVPSISFAAEGIHVIKAEVRDAEGKTAIASQSIVVNSPPQAVLNINPLIVKPGSTVTLDAEGSTDTQDSKNLLVRWDCNGDGVWDLPKGQMFTDTKKCDYTWDSPGNYKVFLEVRDKNGLTDTASAEVQVVDGITIDSIVSPLSAHVGEAVSFLCYASDKDFSINSYSWSVSDDTASEQKTTTSKLTRKFTNAGEFTVTCKAIDEKGFSAFRKVQITIVNANASLSAKGPYKAKVNVPVTLEGVANDPDSKVVSYGWDFDNDGKPDFKSSTTSKTTHTFSKAGRFTIGFMVKTDDGAVEVDKTIVEVANLPPVAHAGVDVISESNQKVKIEGSGSDPDGNLAKFEWDFENDGKFDWSSTKNGIVEHAFEKYSTPVLRITDADGAISLDTVRVVICPKGMVLNEIGKFCVDKYEYPNKEGKLPEVNLSNAEAEKKCKVEGKHLCSSKEWEMACSNNEKKKLYPYSTNFDSEKCNTLGNPFVKNKLSPSGSFNQCAGSTGVYDMSGNVAEWTKNENGTTYAYGGSWQNGENGSNCNSRVLLQKDKKYFYAGFRCCK